MKQMNVQKNKIQTRAGKILEWSVLIAHLLLLMRVALWGNVYFVFLIWNLFLAWVPLLFGDEFFRHADYQLLPGKTQKQLVGAGRFQRFKNRLLLAMLFFLWLIFFPNAPYLMTDFIHLKVRENVPFWFDFLMLAAWAWCGLLLGYLSLSRLQKFIAKKYSALYGWIFVVMIWLLSGYAIYLGRFLRWNSWDIVANPISLISDIFWTLTMPNTWLLSVIFAATFALFYIFARLFSGSVSPNSSASSSSSSTPS